MISWIAAGLMLIGNVILIKYKSWIAFVLMAIGNVLYIYYWFTKQEWATFILVAIFLGQNIWGIVSWRNNAK
jgi:hypothetical protein